VTVEDEILKELKEHTKYLRVQVGLLSEIKFELQNARKLASASYTIKTPSAWERFRYWLRGKIRG